MALYRRRSETLEAFQWQPGMILDGVEERTVTHSHMSNEPLQLGYYVNWQGRGFYVSPGDYVYKDSTGHWDACNRADFERQYVEVETND